MFEALIIISISTILFCIPILFWMYIYSSFPAGIFSRAQFFIGMILGALSAAAFSYLPQSRFAFILDNIFKNITPSQGFIFHGEIVWYLGILFFAMSFLAGSSSLFFLKKGKKILPLSFFGYLGIICTTLLAIGFFLQYFTHVSTNIVMYATYSFVSFGSIVAYYSIIALVEEGIKYFSSLSASSRQLLQHKIYFLLLGASIALGFSFFETLLYAYFYFTNKGLDTGLVQLIFFRSIFSVSLHVFCSLLLSLAFWYVLYATLSLSFRAISLFFLLGVSSIAMHTLFNVSLEYGFMGVLFFYVSALYFVFSYIMGASQQAQ